MELTTIKGRCTLNMWRGDCMEAMREMDAGRYDLAIVDPPYGIGASQGVGRYSKKKFKNSKKEWDNKKPTREYFSQLFRVSSNQIICGFNYFIDNLYPTKSFICWVKNNPAPTFAEAELVWTSFNINGKVYDSKKQIIHQIQKEGGSIHPCQKTVALYKWLLTNYAKPGDTILDTHGGSLSLAIACWDLGFDLDVWELDNDYYRAGVARVLRHTAQGQFDI